MTFSRDVLEHTRKVFRENLDVSGGEGAERKMRVFDADVPGPTEVRRHTNRQNTKAGILDVIYF